MKGRTTQHTAAYHQGHAMYPRRYFRSVRQQNAHGHPRLIITCITDSTFVCHSAKRRKCVSHYAFMTSRKGSDSRTRTYGTACVECQPASVTFRSYRLYSSLQRMAFASSLLKRHVFLYGSSTVRSAFPSKRRSLLPSSSQQTSPGGVRTVPHSLLFRTSSSLNPAGK